MHSAAKLIIGILIFLAGLAWYWPVKFGGTLFGSQNIMRFLDVFFGVFGLALVFLGLIVAWIEYEDLKWESREKKEAKTKQEPAKKKK
jgi:hypothetical protein